MTDVDVLCIGATSFDLVFSVDHQPQADEKTTAHALLSCGGGPAANAAVTVSKLGLQSAFCGYLGNDIFSEQHFKELQSADVNTDLLVRGQQPAPISTVLVKPNGQRSLVNYRSAKPLSVADLPKTKVNPKVILFDGHEPEISDLFLNKVQDKKIKTILDGGSVNPGTLKLYDKVDYLVCSEIFAKEMTNEENPQLALKQLSRHNKNIVITLGEKGLIWKTEESYGQLPAFAVQAVDTTGAGDIFHGAFACCLALKMPWDETLSFCSAAAALSCTKAGARSSIPTLKDVETFLKRKGS